jgi:hypothetical protein
MAISSSNSQHPEQVGCDTPESAPRKAEFRVGSTLAGTMFLTKAPDSATLHPGYAARFPEL